MKKQGCKQRLSFILCLVLIVAMALCTGGCQGKTGGAKDSGGGTTNAGSGTNETKLPHADGSILGEGNTVFEVSIVDQEGTETKLEIHTEKETVGEALQELGVIEGEESEYGLYVKTVNGITANYDTDGVYWAFYINGEYASTGVDATPITEGESYSFRVE